MNVTIVTRIFPSFREFDALFAQISIFAWTALLLRITRLPSAVSRLFRMPLTEKLQIIMTRMDIEWQTVLDMCSFLHHSQCFRHDLQAAWTVTKSKVIVRKVMLKI
jgi:hypothetical protein